MSKRLKARKPTDKGGKQPRDRVRDMKPKPAWFEREPDDPSKTISWNNKTWHWCGAKTGGKCESFVRHKPEDCRGRKRRSNQGDTKGNKRSKAHEVIAQEAIGNNSDGSDPYLSS